MTTITKLALGLFIIIAALFVGITQSPNTSASVNPGEFLACPNEPAVANKDGWSNTFRASLEKSSVSNKVMYCHYKLDIPQAPGAAVITTSAVLSRSCGGRACFARDKGFDLGSAGGEVGE